MKDPDMMDAAPPYVTDYFPARNLFRTGNGGSGHWRVALRSGQDQRFRTVVRSASSEQKMAAEIGEVMHQNQRRQSNKREYMGERVLDTSFLMKTQHVQKPSDLCAADVSDRGLTAAQWEEFQQFTCLAYINASENMLHLESFRTFPALRELDLSMNGIHRITVIPGEFPQLEVLDLSYNSLSPGDIPQLGVLPRLRVLYLTGNRLTQLPPDLSAPPRKSADIHMFPSLEVFMLDDNLLSHPSIFMSLAGLRRLRLLNLDKNAISAIPDLSGAVIRQTEPGVDMEGQGHMTQEAEMTEGELEASQTTEDSVHYMVQRSMTDPDRTEVIFPSPRNPSERTMKPLNGDIPPSSPPGPPMSPTESLSPPLPNLRTLSLVDNKISREEEVLPAALFPSLRELVIHGNPLTTLRKGRPPLLGSFLQERLGIKVTHRKSSGFHKPHLLIPRKDKRKVTTHVPKIPKQPLMLESLLSPLLRLRQPESDVTETVMSSSPLLPPIRTSSEKGMDTPPGRSQESTESSSEEEMSCGPDVEPVFMTQVDNIPDSSAESLHIRSPAPEERDPKDKEEAPPKRIPERFRGYEELYDVGAYPGFIEPVGIQNNVRALEYTLRHLLVYGDFKPRQHSIQKMYIPRESKFGSCHLSSQKTREDLVAEVLRNMKERQQVVEAPLDFAIREGSPRKEHKEAKLLLKELQEKYKRFHEEAAIRASEVEADLRNTARQLLQAQRKGESNHKRATNGRRRGAGRPGKSPDHEDI
ncbi:X-ray radiation resistance-associated protein 1 isoform X2 [Hyla sarda]|uniref:X-ray radiation resistance-associated protein 1 isoform X2 n=1 Tax=Hyla sarda TaxID=327740 RepID=UPI0024C268C8|nr:X-ray radiation resistance-associated protein 1 isoform X2 [Hyla sarda]